MVPQTKSFPRNPLHPDIRERALEPNEERQEVDIADAGLSSAEAWYYVVDCASCKAAIPFKHAPEGEAILRLPTMRVRCFQCSAVHTYATGLISHRKAAAPRGIVRRDQPAKTPDNAQGVPRDRKRNSATGARKDARLPNVRPYPAPLHFSGLVA